MNRYALYIPTFLLYLLIANVYAKSEYMVIADIANIRAKPNAKSSVVAKLHCTARFTPQDSSSDWYFIKDIPIQENYYGLDPENRQINGWIHKSLVIYKDRENYDLKPLGKTLKDSLQWAERLYMAESGNDSLIRPLLVDGFKRAGNSEKSLYYKMILDKEGLIYLAHSHRGKVRLFGSLTRKGEFNTLEYEAYADDENIEYYNGRLLGPFNYVNTVLQDSMQMLGSALIARKWYSSQKFQDEYRDHYFHHASLFPTDSPEVNKNSSYYVGSVESCVTRGISFGGQNRSEIGHTVFATEPIIIQEQSGKLSKEKLIRYYSYAVQLAEKDSCHFSTFDYTELQNGLVEVGITLSECVGCENSEKKRAVFNKDGKILNKEIFTNDSVHETYEYGQRPWFTVKGLEQYRYVVVPYVEHSCASEKGGANCGVRLLRVGPDGVKVYEVRYDQCGC